MSDVAGAALGMGYLSGLFTVGTAVAYFAEDIGAVAILAVLATATIIVGGVMAAVDY